MARPVLAAIAATTFIVILAGTGCHASRVGDPCTPEQEYDHGFLGFAVGEVNIESKSFQCETRVCLVNHFQGRVSCPYGQDSTGNAPSGAAACLVPGSTQKIDGADSTGAVIDPKAGATVKPQCVDRIAAQSVYCSCRCANADGKTDDGAPYCQCPDGYSCTQLVNPTGPSDQGLTGAYCVKRGTTYDPNAGACAKTCDPTAAPCK